MNDPHLLTPLGICLLAGLGAGWIGASPLRRRLPLRRSSWLLAAVPVAALVLILARLQELVPGRALVYQIEWIPSLGVAASFRLDGLSGLFALLVVGVGALVVVYTGFYFEGKDRGWIFQSYLLLFLTSMLGLVLAGDVITLFVFWEATSVTSYLLIGFNRDDPAARQGALKALLITGAGGLALLLGLLLLAGVSGRMDFAGMAANADALRGSPLYPAILALVAIGAFTKSAQAPAHIWLPEAMAAPTPASAYLHSATMVKAGIYLMARLHPALGFHDAWFWLLSLFGVATMLTGAYLGLKQNDLKALLAYSTVSQLGVLMMLIGQGTEAAFKALVIGVAAHALYKGALFLVVGIVDHEAGARDLRRLGGLRAGMPATFLIGAVAGLSMAGLPPLFGFVAKETMLAAAVHPTLPDVVSLILPGTAVVAGALLLAQSLMLIADTFLGGARQGHPAHDPPAGMLLAPALPALLSLAIGVLPEARGVAELLADAAAAAYGAPVKVSLAVWTGISVPLLLSLVAILLGTGLFVLRTPVRALQGRLSDRLTFNFLYRAGLEGIDGLARWATRLQGGRLRQYLAVMLAATGGLIVLSGGPQLVELPAVSPLDLILRDELALLRTFTLLLGVAASLATVVLRRDLFAVLALGASSLSIAVLMVLEPAPDVALVQVVVDVLTMVVLVLALTRLPRAQRMRAAEFTFRQSRLGLLRDGVISAGGGLVMTAVVLTALSSRPRLSLVTPFYERNALPLAQATDIVSAILTDFRSLDTVIEVTVFSIAGAGVYMLLRHAARGDRRLPEPPDAGGRFATTGIGGGRTSPTVRSLAYLMLPLTIVVAATHVLYGHDRPGDGFTAGVIVGLAVGLWYIAFGYEETKRRLTWLRPATLIGSGMLLMILGGAAAALQTGSFLGPADFGAGLGLPLPKGVHLGSALVFEVAIALAVLGSASWIIDTLGHPSDPLPEESPAAGKEG